MAHPAGCAFCLDGKSFIQPRCCGILQKMIQYTVDIYHRKGGRPLSQTERTTQNYRTLRDQQSYADAIRKYLSEKYETPPLAHVHSFGCQQSVYDGERFKGVLAQLGYGFTDEIRQADLILYNTCAVRENAEQRVFGNVGPLKGLKKQKPDLVIALAGCMTEQQQVSEKLKMSYQ